MSVTAIVGQSITASETLTTHQCWKCAVIFAMPQRKEQVCRDTGESFFCPNGHESVFATTTVQQKDKEIARLQNSLNYSNQRADLHQQNYINSERKRSALKGVITKTKKRAANGVCPCCNRYFENVHRHMKTKHPEHGKAE